MGYSGILMKQQFKKYLLTELIFGEYFWFFYDIKDDNQCLSYLEKYFGIKTKIQRDLLAGRTVEFTNDKGNTCIVIMILPNKDRFEVLNTLAHECLHAVNICLDRKGVNIQKDDETHAYLLGHLVRVFSKVLAKSKYTKV